MTYYTPSEDITFPTFAGIPVATGVHALSGFLAVTGVHAIAAFLQIVGVPAVVGMMLLLTSMLLSCSF